MFQLKLTRRLLQLSDVQRDSVRRHHQSEHNINSLALYLQYCWKVRIIKLNVWKLISALEAIVGQQVYYFFCFLLWEAS